MFRTHFSDPDRSDAPMISSQILVPALEPLPWSCPLFASPIRAGFPSPAEDYVTKRLDLNEHLIHHPEATYFLRVIGNSMRDAGIHEGDLLIVDRSLTPVHRSIVIALIDGEFTVKRLHHRAGQIRLLAENPDYPPIELGNGQELQVWGVVTNVIHRLLL